MQIWAAGCLQDSSGWPHLPQPKHVNLLCVLNNPLCKWHMGHSCKSHHSKDNLKQKGSLISDVKEGKNHTCRDEGRGAITGVGHPVWCGGLGAPFICTLLTSLVFFPQKGASLRRRSYTWSWEQSFVVFCQPGRDCEGESLFMDLFCFFCDVHYMKRVCHSWARDLRRLKVGECKDEVSCPG